jgi:LysM repeat protein
VAARAAAADYQALRDLNPELRQRITPPGHGASRYRLRVPPGKGSNFLERYAALPASAKPSLYEYVVQPSDNLSTIAGAFGVRSRLIAEANSITNPNRIFPGQRLFVPAGPGVKIPAAHEKITHTVRSGESLSRISKRYGISVGDVVGWNGLTSTIIRPGDRLELWRTHPRPASRPAEVPLQIGDDGSAIHTVAPGETLWELSRRYKISVAELRTWNGLAGTLIRPGQDLVVGRTAETAGPEMYTVIRGDTLYRIARRFGVTAQALARHNNLSVATALLAGTTLRIGPAPAGE